MVTFSRTVLTASAVCVVLTTAEARKHRTTKGNDWMWHSPPTSYDTNGDWYSPTPYDENATPPPYGWWHGNHSDYGSYSPSPYDDNATHPYGWWHGNHSDYGSYSPSPYDDNATPPPYGWWHGNHSDYTNDDWSNNGYWNSYPPTHTGDFYSYETDSYDTATYWHEDAEGVDWWDALFNPAGNHTQSLSPAPYHDFGTEEMTVCLTGGLLEELFGFTDGMTQWTTTGYNATGGWMGTPDTSWSYEEDGEMDWWSDNEWWFDPAQSQPLSFEEEMSAWLDTLITEAEVLATLAREAAGPNPAWVDWVQDDVAWNTERHDMHEHAHEDTHTSRDPTYYSDRVPFGAFAASLPWVTFSDLDTRDSHYDPEAPLPVVSVDMGGVRGLDHVNLTGAFSSCISRQQSNAFGGLFSSGISAFNWTDPDLLEQKASEADDAVAALYGLAPTHMADVVGGVDLECVLYGFVEGTGTEGHGFGGGKRGVGRGKNPNLPAVHSPWRCPEGEEWTHKDRTGQFHCAKPGEVVEVMGAWGVSVSVDVAQRYAASGTPTTQMVEVVDPVTGTVFTIDITVTAQPAESVELDTRVWSSEVDGTHTVDRDDRSQDFEREREETTNESLDWRLRPSTRHENDRETEGQTDKDEEIWENSTYQYCAAGVVVGILVLALAYYVRKTRKITAAVDAIVGRMPPRGDVKGQLRGAGERVVIAIPAAPTAANTDVAYVQAVPEVNWS